MRSLGTPLRQMRITVLVPRRTPMANPFRGCGFWAGDFRPQPRLPDFLERGLKSVHLLARAHAHANPTLAQKLIRAHADVVVRPQASDQLRRTAIRLEGDKVCL